METTLEIRLELLHFTPVQTDERRAPGLRHVAYEVADLNEAHAVFTAHGVQFLDPLAPAAGAAPRGAFFRAPDGTFIELIQVKP